MPLPRVAAPSILFIQNSSDTATLHGLSFVGDQFFPPEDPQAPTPAVVPQSPLAAEVKAIFIHHCYECHQLKDVKEAKGGIIILDHDLLTITRKVVVPGSPDKSELYQLLVAADDDPLLMPPFERERPTPEEIATVRRWIEDGAPPFPRTPAGGK